IQRIQPQTYIYLMDWIKQTDLITISTTMQSSLTQKKSTNPCPMTTLILVIPRRTLKSQDSLIHLVSMEPITRNLMTSRVTPKVNGIMHLTRFWIPSMMSLNPNQL
ncbi:Hypothetical protein FKW44_021439, partial [Caligus rogercresseyi]